MTKKKLNTALPVGLPIYMDRIAERLVALGFAPGAPQMPGEDREGDFLCRDKSDGKGPYLAKWWTDKPLPTLEALRATLPGK